ncbi:MAG TPA: TetR/AcrR family transcriptional regulator [Solirubrobacterales bacterium]|jgi:AcrR family transcriptional regulator|nr:TetR/AcrR family transcriptional regulator [Solirubrobacterales bacterium]
MPEDEIFRTTLPPGRHKLPRDFVQQHQRERLFAALVALVDEQGYPGTSLTQIVKKAGVARHTFYEHFEDKEALFLALFDRTAERTLEVVAAAAEAAPGPWEGQVRAGLAALLAMIAKDPALTRVVMIESQSAGPEAVARRTAAMSRFGEVLRAGRPGDPRQAGLADSLEDILLGGAIWMINKQLVSDEGGIESLLPELLEFLIAPYRGNAAARDVARQGTTDDRSAPGREV